MIHDASQQIEGIIMEECNVDKTPADFIRDNIEKANLLLDLALENVTERKKVSAEMMKSISSLVDSITTASTSLITAEENAWGLQIREDMLKLKEREIELKSLSGTAKPAQQNIFVGSFGELLKQINMPAARQIEE
jgi:hypothetical protein